MTKEGLLLAAKQSLTAIELRENIFYSTIFRDPENLKQFSHEKESEQGDNMEGVLIFEEDENIIDI